MYLCVPTTEVMYWRKINQYQYRYTNTYTWVNTSSACVIPLTFKQILTRIEVFNQSAHSFLITVRSWDCYVLVASSFIVYNVIYHRSQGRNNLSLAISLIMLHIPCCIFFDQILWNNMSNVNFSLDASFFKLICWVYPSLPFNVHQVMRCTWYFVISMDVVSTTLSNTAHTERGMTSDA